MFKKIVLIAIVLVTSLSCSKTNRHVDKDIGYEITGPSNWYIYKSPDRSVSFAKYNKKKYGNSTINVFIEPLNPLVQSPLDYINTILLPQLKQIFQKEEGYTIRLAEEPCITERNGYRWAKVKHWLLEDTFQIVYVAFSDRHVFMIYLNSTGPQHVEDENLFFSSLDTFRIY